MSERGKEVRPLIDPLMHERLAIIAEFEGLEIGVLAARLLEKTIAGEWLRFDRLIERGADLGQEESPEVSARGAGFVYVIRIGERYKIGKAIDWRKRLSNAMFPEPPEIVCIIETEDRHGLERELHVKYGATRLHGEWFGLEALHVAEILQFPGARAA